MRRLGVPPGPKALRRSDDLSADGLKTCAPCCPRIQMHIGLEGKLKESKVSGKQSGFHAMPRPCKPGGGYLQRAGSQGLSQVFPGPGGRKDSCEPQIPPGPRFEEKNKASVFSFPETPFHPHFAQSVSTAGRSAFTKHLLCARVPDEVCAKFLGFLILCSVH